MKKTVKLALTGNPNAGKTTLFNAITGTHQHVGNYPGITVDKKEGTARLGEYYFHCVDLPGTYSLTAYSQEELVARNQLIENPPDVVIDIINSSALERNLYLAVQIMEMGMPLLLALNMMDEAKAQGISIDKEELSRRLGIPVVETIGRTGVGVEEMLVKAAVFAEGQKGKNKPLYISYGPDLDPALEEMTRCIEKEGFLTNKYPARWLALKYLEQDEEIWEMGKGTGSLAKILEEKAKTVSEHCEKTLSASADAIIADYRYGYIASALRGIFSRDPKKSRLELSDNLDKILTHKIAGPLIMLSVLYLVYWGTFLIGEYPMGWLESFFGFLADRATNLMPEGLLQSLMVSGVIDGVGGVMSFVPLIMIMFLFISFLEDSGYMARIAYMLDRVLRMFGLHGCSVMPFIVSGGIAGGCAVPGIMATRTLRSPKEKLATLLTAPFMNCGAKVPVMLLLAGTFFQKHQALVMFLATLTGWVSALFVAKILRTILIKGTNTPFVMELPPYRLPTLQGMLIHTWNRTWQYIKKAGTIILAISILLWVLMTFPRLSEEQETVFINKQAQLENTLARIPEASPQAKEITNHIALNEYALQEAALRNSFAGRLGTSMETISLSAGFDWRTNIALIGGFAAKEVIVSTLGTAYSLGEVDVEEPESLSKKLAADPSFTSITAVALMLFVMLYAPCFVTVVAIAREAGSWKWAAFSVVFNTGFAFVVATGVYQAGRAFGF